MHILIAPDSFKGTLSAAEVCDIIGQAFKDTIKDAEITKLPAADGGEGLCACLQAIIGGETVLAEVCGVFGERIKAEYLMLNDKTAVIEMAACAGLPLAGKNKNPEKATTFGAGELIKDAVNNGAEKILLGLGGSATNDCGLGMAAALGWKFIDEKQNEFIPTGETMCKVMHIIRPEKGLGISVTAACDVENPLFGENGAAYVFAPQKGADEAMVKRLDSGLRHVSDIITQELNADISQIKGAGAAGGMGAGAVAFLNAELKKGIDILLDAADFERKAASADLIITGEGRLDFQSVNGKVISGIAQRAEKHGKKVIAICGSKGKGAEEIKQLGVSELYFSCETDKPFDEIIKTCKEDLYNISAKTAKSIFFETELG
ncbi:MAG: glycerate kinase [Clostridia bacterium]|nr:glycerate kinase [Clostridia bacterium]